MKLPAYTSLDRLEHRFGSKSDWYTMFYRQKEIFLSDALIEAKLLPRLQAFSQVKGGAVYGYADQVRLVLEIGARGRKGEHLACLQPEKVSWSREHLDLQWRVEVFNPQGKALPATEDEAVAGPVRDAIAALSLLLLDGWAVASGLASAGEVPTFPDGLVTLTENRASIESSRLSVFQDLLKTGPFQGNFLFTMMAGVDITTLSLAQLFPVREVLCRTDGVTLKMEFAPEYAKVQDELFSFNQHLKFLKR